VLDAVTAESRDCSVYSKSLGNAAEIQSRTVAVNTQDRPPATCAHFHGSVEVTIGQLGYTVSGWRLVPILHVPELNHSANSGIVSTTERICPSQRFGSDIRGFWCDSHGIERRENVSPADVGGVGETRHHALDPEQLRYRRVDRELRVCFITVHDRELRDGAHDRY
jgi:hypothetical protein